MALVTLAGLAPRPSLTAATVWDGPRMTFSKIAGADPMQEENQDRITPNVWLTRGNVQGLYNARTETAYAHNFSPADTLWADGHPTNYASLTFTNWEAWAKSHGGPPNTPGIAAVVRLVSEDIYLGLRIVTWDSRAGGFAYERTTPSPDPSVAPAITVQPRSQILARCPGPNGFGDVTFTVEATGTPAPGFYWHVWCPPQFPNCGCILRPPQPGSSNLVLPGVTPDCAGGYYVVVSNAAGSVTSEVAHLVFAPEVAYSDNRFPLPNSRFEVRPSRYLVGQPGLPPAEVVIEGLTLRLPGTGQALPAPGEEAALHYDVEAACQVSTDGGATFLNAVCSGQANLRLRYQGDYNLASNFKIEIDALNLAGGSLPAGLMLRESPTRASLGRTSLRLASDGTYRLSSFFDIFTEISLDGGQTWAECQEGSSRALLAPTTREFSPPDDHYPPLESELSQAADGKDEDCDGTADPAPIDFMLADGGSVTLSNLVLQVRGGSVPFTSLAVGQELDLACDVLLDLTTANGLSRHAAPATLRVRHDNRASTTFQMEVVSLEVGGGTLPAGIRLRESPTLPSRGYASRRSNADGTTRVSSFFDIFTEISLDGGQNWVPAGQPVGVGMRLAVPPAPLVIYCPPNQVVLTCSNSAVVTYQVRGIGQEGEVVCSPPSGTEFPLGDTLVTCTATNGAGAVATCTFTVAVKAASPEVPCAWQAGLGIPFELVGGATATITPDADPQSPAISIYPAAGVADSGILLHPGPAQGLEFTVALDFAAPLGAGFDLALPPDPAGAGAPPILSGRSSGDGKSWCFALRVTDEAANTRLSAVNTNGQVLEPLTFTPAEAACALLIESMGGATNFHLTVQFDGRSGGVSLEFEGSVEPAAAGRKGWDGCIYGPDRPIKKGTSRVMLVPPVIPGASPITDLLLVARGMPELPVQQPALAAAGRKWGDGHVTLMKAYDDGAEQGMEFRAMADGGGVHTDLGEAAGFQLRFHHSVDGAIPEPQQIFRLLTNRPGPGPTYPPPPPIEARLTSGAAGVDFGVDYRAHGISNVTVELKLGGVRTAIQFGVVYWTEPNLRICTLDRWPTVLGCPGVGVLRLADSAPFQVTFADGTSELADEVLVIPELPPGAAAPAVIRGLECVASAGVVCRISEVQVTPALTAPLRILCPADIVVAANSASGAAVSYFPTVLFGDCPLLPLADIVGAPPSGSVFPVGTTSVTVTAHNGCGETVSCTFNVTVLPLPIITVQPRSQIVPRCPGPGGFGDVTFTVEATGTPTPDFYWHVWCPPQFPNCGCILRPPQPGSSSLVLRDVTPGCAGGYYVVVSNAAGSVTSEVAHLVFAPEVPFSNDRFPPPNSRFEIGSSGQDGVSFHGGGVVIRDLALRALGSGQELPAPGKESALALDVEVTCLMSVDKGLSFQSVACPGQVNLRVLSDGDFLPQRGFRVEIDGLELAGGNLPAGLRLRESPTRASTGRTTVRLVSDGSYRLSSFFDIFTEISLDDGTTWTASDRESQRALLAPTTREFAPVNDYYPPFASELSQAADGRDDDCDGRVDSATVSFPGGVLLSNLALRNLEGAVSFAALSSAQDVALAGQVTFDLQTPGGAFQCVAPVMLRIRENGRASTTFQMEVVALDIGGGKLPAGLRLRESPTLPSRGYASRRLNANGSTRLSSFFDIFLEVSLDEGKTWSPSSSGPVAVGVGPAPAVNFSGVEHFAQGSAVVLVQSNALVLSNIGSSGQDGVAIQTGGGQAFGLSLLLDMNAPEGAQIIVSELTADGTNAPLLSFVKSCRPACGWDIKLSKRLADGGEFRVGAVNADGDLLGSPVVPPGLEDSDPLLTLFPETGLDQLPVFLRLDAATGAIAVSFPGSLARRLCNGLPCPRGWDGTVKGRITDENGRLPKDSTVHFTPTGDYHPPPRSILVITAAGLTEYVVADERLVVMGREWRARGHLTVLKAAADDNGEEGVRFEALSGDSGVSADLGQPAGFELGMRRFGTPQGEQLFRLGGGLWPPGTTTNRPPPPIDLRLAQTLPGAGVVCAADYNALGISNVTVQLWDGPTLVGERTGVPASLSAPIATLSVFPGVLGCPGVGVLRLSNSEPFAVTSGLDCSSCLGTELRIIPEVPSGVLLPISYREFECYAGEGAGLFFHGLRTTPLPLREPVSIVRTTEGIGISWDDGAFRLQGADNVAGPWFDLGASPPFYLGSGHPARFFRVRGR